MARHQRLSFYLSRSIRVQMVARRHVRRVIFFYIIFIFLTDQGPSQEENRQVNVVLMPWHLKNVDAYQTQGLTVALRDQRERFAKESLGDHQTLAKFRSRRGLSPLNRGLRSFSEEVWVSAKEMSQHGIPVKWSPVLCDLGDQFIIFLLTSSLRNHRLLGVSHLTLEKKPSALINLMRDKVLYRLWRSQEKHEPALDHLVKLRINTVSQQKALGGSDLCLSLILAQSLLPQTQVIVDVGVEQDATLRRCLDIQDLPLRHNQVLGVRWRGKEGLKPSSFSPELGWRLTEGVFSLPHAKAGDEPVKLTKVKNSYRLTLPNQLIDQIRTLATTLRQADKPMVARINGAWAYLDRGRSWGLRMRDRLMVDAAVKGHVVGFFGAEAKIHSPRGFLIREGAIIFIRKGQRELEIGQEFVYDPLSFPTDLPAND